MWSSDHCVNCKHKSQSRKEILLLWSNFWSNHLFKWVDEAHLEEFDVLASKQEAMMNDLAEIKKDIVELKNDMREIIEVIELIRTKL